MENITLEKIINFDCVIDSLDNLIVDDNVKYDILDDNTHAKGVIKIDGNVKTVLGNKVFSETVDVDIFAPFEKQIDRADFKISIKDYSYVVNQNKLIIYLIISLDGFITPNETGNAQSIESNESIVENINNLNETIQEESSIQDEKLLNREEKVEAIAAPKIPIIKNTNEEEKVKDTWATDIFKLDEKYSVFVKISKK